MTTALAAGVDRDTPAGLLTAMRRDREDARQAEIRLMTDALAWAHLHSTDSLDDAMTITVPGADHQLAIAGDGAPLVADFAVAELATALGRTADSARMWLGTVIEARHRLPHVWAQLVDGPLEPYKVRQIAERTLLLNSAAAAWVDHELAPLAHKIGPVRLARIIDEAIRRFDPEEAKARELAAAERRHVSVYDREVNAGCVPMAATLDAVDAADLEAAVARAAHALLLAGSDDSLDVRRALALGEIARRELALDLATGKTTSVGASAATLYVHLNPGHGVAHIEKGAAGYTLGLERLQAWLTRPGITVTIRPVLDLNETITSSGYQPPPRLREQVILRNPTCVFPHCGRPARTGDIDHIDPWERGGPTSSDNLAPCCRLHHRLKTHGGWAYTPLTPGEFLWRSPYGSAFHVDPTGTTAIHN